MTPSILDKEVTALRARADALLEIGRYRDAVPLLQSGLNQTPDDARLLCRLAFAFHKMKEPTEALRWANEAVGADPSEEWGHRLRSIILLEEGMTAEAVRAAEEAVNCNLDSEQSLHALVKALLGAKEKTRAAQVADHLCLIAPASIWTHNASALAAMHLHQWEKVISHCEASIAIDPEVYSAWNNLGMAQMHLSKCLEAEASFREAARLMPTEKTIHQRIAMARTYQRLKETQGAAPLVDIRGLLNSPLTANGLDIKSAKRRRKQSIDGSQEL